MQKETEARKRSREATALVKELPDMVIGAQRVARGKTSRSPKEEYEQGLITTDMRLGTAVYNRDKVRYG